MFLKSDVGSVGDDVAKKKIRIQMETIVPTEHSMEDKKGTNAPTNQDEIDPVCLWSSRRDGDRHEHRRVQALQRNHPGCTIEYWGSGAVAIDWIAGFCICRPTEVEAHLAKLSQTIINVEIKTTTNAPLTGGTIVEVGTATHVTPIIPTSPADVSVYRLFGSSTTDDTQNKQCSYRMCLAVVPGTGILLMGFMVSPEPDVWTFGNETEEVRAKLNQCGIPTNGMYI